MKWMSLAFAATLMLATVPASAFEDEREASARVFFSLPLGGAAADAPAPAFGLRLAAGGEPYAARRSLAAFEGGQPRLDNPLSALRGFADLRFGLDGSTSLIVNGFDVGGFAGRLNASDDERTPEEQRVWEEYVVPAIGIGAGVALFVVGKELN